MTTCPYNFCFIQHIQLQILEALKASHATGIVHRDVKPQNVIISETDNKIKFIDLGAAADLRVGINYVPNEYLLDPRYAPPQQYIMSTQAGPPALAPLGPSIRLGPSIPIGPSNPLFCMALACLPQGRAELGGCGRVHCHSFMPYLGHHCYNTRSTQSKLNGWS